MVKETNKQQNWEENLKNLPAINYNLYIGSEIDACDDCLEFEVALKQLEDFIKKLLKTQRKEILEELEQWANKNKFSFETCAKIDKKLKELE